MKRVYQVNMIESERGWGQKVDQVIYFKTSTAALQYAADYNEKYNNQPVTPDWYIMADYVGEVTVPDAKDIRD